MFNFAMVMDLLSKALFAGGGLTCAVGLINLALGMKDQEGSKIQGAIWTAISGGIIILASALVKNITL